MLPSQQTVVDVLLRACDRYQDQTAFTCMRADLSYRKLAELSGYFAGYLQRQGGLVAGDRIAIQLPNILQFPVAVLGALRAGLVVVNINPLYTEQELEYQLRDSGAKALVVLANTAASACRVVERTAVERVIVTQLGDLHGPLRGPLLNFVLKHIKKAVPPLSCAGAVKWSRALAPGRTGRTGSRPPAAARPGDLALLQYTGGTTGVSKGAMLSHANLVANLLQISELLQEDSPRPGEVMVAPLPLYHIYAFTVHMLYALHQGLHNLLIPNPRDIAGLVSTLGHYRMAGFVGINTLYNALCGSSAFARLDFSQLRIACAGGMALSPKTAHRWQALTGCRILEGYGLSEASPVVSGNSSRAFREGSIGKPLPGTQVKVLDELNRELPRGEAGELCVKGPQVMLGYWQRPEETGRVLDADGWLHTGDVAIIDADGFMRIVDRIKDLIIVSGYNVFPAEVEEYVCRHPAVQEAAVVGVQRGEGGEKVKLFVVCNDPSLGKKELTEYCRAGLANYKVPRLIEFCESLPKSSVGKVLRRQLRDAGRETGPLQQV